MSQMLKRREVLMGAVAMAATVAVGATTCDASAGEPVLEVYEVWGTIKWFDASKGYGFISCDNGRDVLLHRRCLETSGYSAVGEGARVRIYALPRPKGMQAYRILELDRTMERYGQPQRVHTHVANLND